MPVSKATKKFERNKLHDVLKKRKEVGKIKQRKQRDIKRKERKARDDAKAEPLPNDENTIKSESNKLVRDKMSEMSMDQFFQGGFQIMGTAQKASIETKSSKRKRTPVEGEVMEVIQKSDTDSDEDDDEDAHKAQLAELAQKDPEFYEYLKENDAELLDFARDADLAGIDDLSASEDEEAPGKKRKSTHTSNEAEEMVTENQLTRKMVQRWKLSMETQFSVRAMKEMVLAFRAAAHLNDDEGKEYRYSISDSDVYHEVLVTTLQLVPKVLQHHLPVKETATGKIRVPTDSKKFRTLAPLLKSHTGSVNHLLENLSDTSTLSMTLESLSALLPYIMSFKKMLKEVIKTVTSVWSDAANGEMARLSAFLVLRRLLVIADPSIREAVLKHCYQGLIRGARNTTVHNIQGINLMKNTASELWSIDSTVGYTTGFGFIRQLAIHLRTSITNKTKDSYKTVYNWQYVHSLDFWSRVVAADCESLREAETGKPSPLRPLIYPIVQITLGAMRLVPTAQYFPLRFQLVRSLLRISSATSTYIPLAAALMEVLNSAEMKKPPKPSTLTSLDFGTAIRATEGYLRTRVYQDGVGEQVAELFVEFFVIWSKTIAFPELALPVIVMLKRWIKAVVKKSSGNCNEKIRSLMALLVQKLEANSRWIEEKRAKVDFAPNDRAGVDNFVKEVDWQKTPLGGYAVGQRKVREQKAKLLEDARKTADKKRKEAEKEEIAARSEGVMDEDEDNNTDSDMGKLRDEEDDSADN